MKSPLRRRSAFTIMEIMVVVVIIGILAAIAIPVIFRSAKSTMIGVQESDLRSFERAFTTFELEHEFLPASQGNSGQFPEDMDGLIGAAWKEPAPIGGVYTWIHSPGETTEESVAYIRIRGTAENPIALSMDELIKLDKAMDDGDRNSGQLILSGLDIRFYISQ